MVSQNKKVRQSVCRIPLDARNTWNGRGRYTLDFAPRISSRYSKALLRSGVFGLDASHHQPKPFLPRCAFLPQTQADPQNVACRNTLVHTDLSK